MGRVEREIDNLPLVAHNKAFDENVLRATCRMYGIDMPDVPFYCTLQQARRVIPRWSIKNYRLPTVCAYLGVPFGKHHNALDDAEGCARIAQYIF